MAREKVTAPTLADYVVIVLSPALIMALVGSLVFFLAEVLYVGNYGDRLRWMLFFFVFGSVLIARISMQGEISVRAPIYGLFLGGLVWFGMLAYVRYPSASAAKQWSGLINLGLIALVWFCAYKLTWDCTHIDDDVEITGEGLLQAAGLESVEQRYGVAEEESKESQKLSWWDRWHRYRQERKKKRTPGVWVVYFSLAALPLYGLGQALIPPEATERRQYAFWLMVVYVGASLGLLLTTCFLGLRRYLRQRNVQMPASMAGVWLTLGGLLIVGLLALGAFLPRPNAEYSLLPREAFQFGQGDADRDADKAAPKGESAAKDKDSPKGKDRPGKKDDSRRDRPKDSSRDRGKDKQQGKDSRNPGKDKQQGKQSGGKGNKSGGKSKSDQQGAAKRQFEQATKFLKKLVMILVIIAIVILVILALLRYLAPFTAWARRLLDALWQLWASLFGGLGATDSSGESTPEPRRETPPRPFSDFPNPYLTGRCEMMSLRETIRFTFAAVEAWAREQGSPRAEDETPREFTNRLGDRHPEFAKDLRQLADLYAHAVYSESALPRQLDDVLRRFWERFDEFVAEQAAKARGLEEEGRTRKWKKKRPSKRK